MSGSIPPRPVAHCKATRSARCDCKASGLMPTGIHPNRGWPVAGGGTLQDLGAFAAVDELRGQQVLADQQHRHRRVLQPRVDLGRPNIASPDAGAGPDLRQTGRGRHILGIQQLAPTGIVVAVADKDLGRGSVGQGGPRSAPTGPWCTAGNGSQAGAHSRPRPWRRYPPPGQCTARANIGPPPARHTVPRPALPPPQRPPC